MSDEEEFSNIKSNPAIDFELTDVYDAMGTGNTTVIIQSLTYFLEKRNTRLGWAELLWAAKEAKNESWVRILETVGAEDMNDIIYGDEYNNPDSPLYGRTRQPHRLHELKRGEKQIVAVFDEWKNNSFLPSFSTDRIIEKI